MEGGSGSQSGPRRRTFSNSVYFDILPIEIFPTIIKYVFNTRSSREEDSLSVSSKKKQQILSLSMLISDNSPFREAVSQLSLSKVELGKVADVSGMWMDNGTVEIGPELFEDEGLKPGVPEQLLKLCGKSVKVASIFLDAKDLPPIETSVDGVLEKFATLIKMCCPNVENLSLMWRGSGGNALLFEYIVPELLEQFSPQLRAIKWNDGGAHLEYRRLLDISSCKQIRELEFPPSPQLIRFLCKNGPTLESLTVVYLHFGDYLKIFSAIERFCASLSTLLFYGCYLVKRIVGEERYANVLCSFGCRLVRAEVDVLTLGELARVVRACPNLLVTSKTVSVSRIGEWERVDLLGSMIKHLSVPAEMCCGEKYGEAIAKCTNLKHLTIMESYGDDEQRIKNSSGVTFLLSQLSSSLTGFKYYNFHATRQNLCMLSSALRNVGHLNLKLAKSIESGIDFNTITHSNPQLKDVVIDEPTNRHEKRGKNQSMEVLRMLVNAFSNCRSIDFVLLNEEERVTQKEIQEICGSLSCRVLRVRIRVGSTYYWSDGLRSG